MKCTIGKKHISIFLLILFLPAFSKSPVTIEKSGFGNQFPVMNIEFTLERQVPIAVKDISEENISVYEDGQKVSTFTLHDITGSPLLFYLIFSMDSSKSINKENFRLLKKNAISIVKKIGSGENIALSQFDDEVKELSNFTTNKEQIINKIDKLVRQGKKTLLYNSIFKSLQHLGTMKSSKKFLLVFTDGLDEGSRIKESEILELNRELKIPVYLILPKVKEQKKNRIKKLESGDIHIYILDKSDISEEIISSLNVSDKRSYRLQYASSVKQDGREHIVEIRIKTGNFSDATTGKFIAPGNSFSMNILSETQMILLIIVALIVILLILNIYIIKKKFAPIQQPRDSGATLPQIKTSDPDSLIPAEELESHSIEKNKNIFSDESPAAYTDAWLMEKSGIDFSTKFPIYGDEISLGSSEKCFIIINEKNINPVHARIKKIQNKFYLFDMISDIGTYLNGKKLLRPKALHDWDEISVGKKTLIFRGSSVKK